MLLQQKCLATALLSEGDLELFERTGYMTLISLKNLNEYAWISIELIHSSIYPYIDKQAITS